MTTGRLISFEEIDEHFLADARQGVAAPVRAGDWRRDAHLGAGSVIGRGASVAADVRMVKPAVAGGVALPVELHLDAVIAVRLDDGARWAHDNGALLTGHERARMQQMAMAVRAAAAVRHAATQYVDPVAVHRTVAHLSADGVQADVLHAQHGMRLEILVASTGDATKKVGAQVVVHQVDGAHDSKRAAVVTGGLIELN